MAILASKSTPNKLRACLKIPFPCRSRGDEALISSPKRPFISREVSLLTSAPTILKHALRFFCALRFSQAIKEPLTPQIKFLVCQCSRGAENVLETIHRQRFVVAIMAQHNRDTIAACNVDAARGADGRSENKVADALEPD